MQNIHHDWKGKKIIRKKGGSVKDKIEEILRTSNDCSLCLFSTEAVCRKCSTKNPNQNNINHFYGSSGKIAIRIDEEIPKPTYKTRLDEGLIRKISSWIAEYSYRKANPDGDRDCPGIVYEQTEKDFRKFLSDSNTIEEGK